MFQLITKVFPHIEQISAKEAAARAATGEMVLVDVRSNAEVARFGKATNALHIELPYIRHKANRTGPHFEAALDPAKPIAIYCENGARSLMAARIMKKLGYEQVYNMGAFREWMNAKLPVEK
ncbi:MAG: rhodanese-like domain-containing protein [Rhodobacteraceae bacterium]|nr:rhodanese-like domain-containing protein [Paracoccaceae bacterium]